MRVLITGSTGLLGRACVGGALRRGWGVVGVDRATAADVACRTFVGSLHDPYAIHRALDLCEQALGGPADAVVHLANHTNARVASGEVVLRENLSMNTSVFAGAIERGVRRLVFASSVQAFLGGIDGPMEVQETRRPPRFPIDETLEPRPTNAYGLSKLLTERMLGELCGGSVALGGFGGSGGGAGGGVGSALSGVSVRLPYVLTDQSYEMVAERARRGEQGAAEYRWGGPEAFSYIHADDAASALLLSADAGGASGIVGHEVVWVAADEPRTWEPASVLVDRFYADVEGAGGCGERGSFHDLGKARRLLGWSPARPLSAVRRAVAR